MLRNRSHAPLRAVCRVAPRLRRDPPERRTATGKGTESGASISLAPELRELLPEVSTLAPIDIESAKRDAFRAFRSLFSNLATTQPLLIVLEDLHWSDEASTELVLHLARQARTTAIMLLLTFRSGEVQPGLGALLAGLERERLAARLDLQRLTRSDVDALLQAILRLDRPARADFLDLVVKYSEGNPFLIEEIIRSLVASGEMYSRDGRWGLSRWRSCTFRTPFEKPFNSGSVD